MCGICGSISVGKAVVDPDLVKHMIGVIRHRGPDDCGFYTDARVGFGHARLSIIDIAGGRQPMFTPDRSLCITFNGEIFNYVELREELIKKGHKFATRSDTEVLLHLYAEEGDDCVQRLNGQWAFAIWDVIRERLFISRDRLGVRPLFYTQTANGFLFASEIKALLACPEVECELDLHALDQIFTFWFALPPRTAFRNIWQLPPGHSLVLEGGRLRVWAYWRLEFAPEDDKTADGQERLTEELQDLLLDATRIRLRSDVPVGAYLSGGLDSTFITALIKKLRGDNLRTFSVSFEDSEFDESPYQTEASEFLRTQHSSVRCTCEDIARVFPEVIWHTEQPIIRTAPAPMFLLSNLVRNSGFKVVLTGEGADETLGGYDIFKEAKIRRFWGQNPASAKRPLLLKRLYPYIEAIQRQPSAYLKGFFHVSAEDLRNPLFSHLPRWDLTSKLKLFLSEAVRAETASPGALLELEQGLPRSYAAWSFFNQAEYLEMMYLLPGYILSSQGDRMAMAHAVEGRYPFLDFRVVEYAAKIPPGLKMKVLDEKHVLKQAAKGLVPESIQKRDKQPYRAPDGNCFFGSTVNYVMEMLSPDRIRREGIFNPLLVSALVAKFKAGRGTSMKDNMALVGILSTEILLERFMHRSADAGPLTARVVLHTGPEPETNGN